MVEINPIKSKAISMSAIMGDKKLSQIISDALNSSPGSSKRERARAIITSLSRSGINDGMGGPGVNVLNTPDNSTVKVSSGAGQVPGVNVANPTLQGSSVNIQGSSPNIQGSNINLQGGTLPTGPATLILPSTPTLKQPELNVSSEQTGGLKVSRGASGSWGDEETTGPTGVNTGMQYGPTAVTEVDFTDQWYNGLSNADKKSWAPLYEALKAGVGPKTFAMQMMSDTAKIKALPGMENVPSDSLPTGASLMGQINSLDKALRTEYKLDEFSKNLTTLNERGIDLTDNLSSYITARDKYIESLDGMIDKARESALTMSSNPWAQKKSASYLNYLYTLKGRQQKRYVDALNMGINYHNKELTQAQNAYNNANKLYNDMFKTKSGLLKENYENMSTMLEEMYSNIEGREKKSYEMNILKNKSLQADYETAADSLNSLSDIGGMTDSQIVSSQANYFTENPQDTLIDWYALPVEQKIKYTKASGSADEDELTATEREDLGAVRNMMYENISKEEIIKNIRGQGYNETDEPWASELANYNQEEKTPWYKALYNFINPFD